MSSRKSSQPADDGDVPHDERYPRLEPHHTVELDDDGLKLVRCTFIDFVTPWSPAAGDDEIGCEACELLHRLDEHPDLQMPECADHGDVSDEPDEPPGPRTAHGPTHWWTEVASCKPRLRRIHVFGVWLSVDEGIVADCMEADRRWRELGGKDFYLLEQWHCGSYACRNSVGHSRALAIDFNWQRQGMVSKRNPCPQDPQMERFFDLCWKPLGYGWGGRWRSKCDAMHVSKVPGEGGNGRLFQKWADSPAPVPGPGSGEQRYTVRSGDTLAAIADAHGTTWEALAERNNLPDPDQLDVGQVLIVPSASAPPKPPPPTDDFKEKVMTKPVLKEGATGPEVKVLQCLLVAHGNTPGSWFGPKPYGQRPDGIFGSGVRKVLADWQGYTGKLKADGVCGPETWAWLVLV